MGYVFITATCYGCRRVVNCNPVSVPSFQGQPICRSCIEEVNRQKRERGLPEVEVPADAYEPVNEAELEW